MLHQKCQPITKFDSGLRVLVDAMFETMTEADGVGLAAPQIGVSSRLFVINIQGVERRAYVNPQIIETSIEIATAEEGCLSVPGVWHDVARPERVTVQAQDIEGKVFTVKAEGLLARALQHEYDHLNGVLFLDRLSDEEKEKMIKAYEKRSRVKKGRKP